SPPAASVGAMPTDEAARSRRGSRGLRFLDETVAVALLAVLGAVRRKRALPTPIRRIGLLKSTGIGDMVLAAAVVEDVVRTFPDAEIVLFAGTDNAAVARMVEGVRVVKLAIAEPVSAVRRLRAEGLDVLVDFGQWSRIEALCC